MAAAAALATATRGTRFTVLLSAIYVLAHQITGATDLAIRAVTAGRDELEFHNTLGLFLNAVPFRTEIADCTSFRDIIVKTRETFIDAMSNELPASVIEQAFPDFITSREDPRKSQFLILQPPGQYGEIVLPIAEGARETDELLLEEAESSDIPSGVEWHLNTMPDGAITGSVHFNLDEFDRKHGAGLDRRAQADPDQRRPRPRPGLATALTTATPVPRRPLTRPHPGPIPAPIRVRSTIKAAHGPRRAGASCPGGPGSRRWRGRTSCS